MNPLDAKLAVILPAFNEAAGLDKTLCELVPMARRLRAEVIVVDDGSDDATSEVAQRHAEVRGRDSAGVALITPERVEIYKEPVCASRFIRTPAFRRLFDRLGSLPKGAADRIVLCRCGGSGERIQVLASLL